eukprot:TRINITY_DN4335_c0_g1_i8.p1 TRINITY_DN4335_c0_g1~~TRINITY_DN4335_c0_g1_i8.p1  ORF type:complete len:701 (-),score=139.66 TRINITY_DN4335_c0_g1_i8:87-2189(-)
MAAAKEAKKINKKLKVAIFDYVKPSPAGTTWGLGGTCVNVGCIPKKLMHYSGLLGHSFEVAEEFGWKVKNKMEFSWESLSQTVRDYIGSLNWSYKRQLQKAGVKYFHAYARFADKNTIEYEEKGEVKKLTSKHVIVATGGRPNYGTTPGKEVCISSDDLFWKKENPGKVLVIGAGYIALECASFLNEFKLAEEVSVMVRSEVMRKFDAQCGAQIGELLERSGIRFILPASTVHFRKLKENFPKVSGKEITEGARKGQIELPKEKDGHERYLLQSGAIEKYDSKTGDSTYTIPKGPIEVAYQIDGDSKVHVERFDNVLLAMGRSANITNIGLEKAGVRTNMGKILVDDEERTTQPNIFALGDVATAVKKHGLDVDTAVFFDSAGKGAPKDLFSGVITAATSGKFEIRSTQKGAEGKVFKDIPEKDIQYRSSELPELTPVAIQAGNWLVRRLYTKATDKMQYKLIPSTVFTVPEYGFIGLTTEEAEREEKEGGIGKENVEVWHSRYGPIEQTPTHPHYVKPRSHHLIDKNLWASKYATKHKLWWPDTGFDEQDYATVVYNDGKTKVDATITGHQQNDDGEWVYNLEIDSDHREVENVTADKLELRGEAIEWRFQRYVKSNHLAKLVVDKRNGKVIGFHFIGNNAGEVTQGFSLALKLGATKQDFDKLTGIHPTAAEEFAVLEVTRSSNENFVKQEGCGGGSC